MELKVKEVMNKKVYTTKVDTSVAKATKLMKKYSVGSLIIVDGTAAVGIITTTDVLYKVVALDKNPKKVEVKKIMSSPLVVIDPEATLHDAAKLMTKNSIKKLPVIDSDRALVGVLATSDLVAHRPEFLNVLVNLKTPTGRTNIGG